MPVSSRLTHCDLRLHTLVSCEGWALRATVPFWPSSCNRDVRERRCGLPFGTLDAQATAQPSCEEALPDRTLRKLSL
jgi:hypothetical protein